jgi:hypothetical protein
MTIQFKKDFEDTVQKQFEGDEDRYMLQDFIH